MKNGEEEGTIYVRKGECEMSNNRWWELSFRSYLLVASLAAQRILAQKFKYFFSKPREVQIFLRDLFCQYIFMTTGKIGTAALNDFVLVCGETEPSGEIWKLIRRGKGRLISELQVRTIGLPKMREKTKTDPTPNTTSCSR